MKQTRSATPAPPGKRPLLDSIRKVLPWYLFIAPASLMLLTLLAYPLIDTLRLSLFKWGGLGPQTFVGMRNFSKLFGDEIFWLALRNSFIFAIVVPFFTVSVGLFLGVAISRRMKGWQVYRIAFFIPVMMSGVVVATLWANMFEFNHGLFNTVLRGIGLDGLAQNWLGRPQCRFDQRDDGADLAVGRISNDRVAGIHRRHSAGDA